MLYVTLAAYSKFYHAETGTEFLPVLDHKTGCYIAVAPVSGKTAKAFAGKPGFKLLTEDQYQEMSRPAPEPEPEPSETGDPLTGQAGTAEGTDLTGPPPPPSA